MNIYVMDTPGLEQVKGQKNAAVEIEKGLVQAGRAFKINFVITLTAGRIEMVDMLTINKVKQRM
jgi:hypothetical protein